MCPNRSLFECVRLLRGATFDGEACLHAAARAALPDGGADSWATLTWAGEVHRG